MDEDRKILLVVLSTVFAHGLAARWTDGDPDKDYVTRTAGDLAEAHLDECERRWGPLKLKGGA